MHLKLREGKKEEGEEGKRERKEERGEKEGRKERERKEGKKECKCVFHAQKKCSFPPPQTTNSEKVPEKMTSF